MKYVAALAVAGLALALSSCGSADPGTAADPGDPSSQPTSPSTPASSPTSPEPLSVCKDVWVAKAKLPGDYVGCTKGTKRLEAQQVMCESGQVIVTYAGRFYAVPGRVINDVGHLASSKQYQSAMASCQE